MMDSNELGRNPQVQRLLQAARNNESLDIIQTILDKSESPLNDLVLTIKVAILNLEATERELELTRQQNDMLLGDKQTLTELLSYKSKAVDTALEATRLANENMQGVVESTRETAQANRLANEANRLANESMRIVPGTNSKMLHFLMGFSGRGPRHPAYDRRRVEEEGSSVARWPSNNERTPKRPESSVRRRRATPRALPSRSSPPHDGSSEVEDSNKPAAVLTNAARLHPDSDRTPKRPESSTHRRRATPRALPSRSSPLHDGSSEVEDSKPDAVTSRNIDPESRSVGDDFLSSSQAEDHQDVFARMSRFPPHSPPEARGTNAGHEAPPYPLEGVEAFEEGQEFEEQDRVEANEVEETNLEVEQDDVEANPRGPEFCAARTKDDNRPHCSRRTITGSVYCWQHDNMYNQE